MSTPATPHIECEQHHATLSVSDVRAAADFYTKKLGFIVAFTEGDPPTFAHRPRRATSRTRTP